MSLMHDRATENRGLSYQELLDADSRPVPEQLRTQGKTDFGLVDIPIDYYRDPAYHALEVEHLWRKSWLMACREEEIPEVGDTTTFDIVDDSILLVRVAPDSVKAFYNSCLHRGRPLRDYPGRVSELRCPYHGFAWTLEGNLLHVPAEWDFPQVDAKGWCLPQVQVGQWGGFVFINMDDDAASLESFLGNLSWHFERWPLEDRYKRAHVAKIFPVNWKALQEAFMESYHVVTTHPELLPMMGDTNSQYDAFGNFARAISANATPSPHLREQPSNQEILDAMMDRRLDDPAGMDLPEGMSPRSAMANVARTMMAANMPTASDFCDSEVLDSFYFTVFPNFHPWGALNQICYRFRPNGSDHQSSIMECMMLAPFTGDRPEPAPVHWLEPDEDWINAPELGLLCKVFNQDSFNLRELQRGINTTRKSGVTLSGYQELKIRHFYSLYQQMLGLEG